MKINYINRGTEKEYLTRWVDITGIEEDLSFLNRCNIEYIQRAVEKFPGTKVISVEMNYTGVFQAPIPEGVPEESKAGYFYEDLPPYCEVILEREVEGGHVEKISVWVPLAWNGRFLGVAGGGNWIGFQYGVSQNDFLRFVEQPIAIRNGFASATTDGGNKYPNRLRGDWGLNEETGELDWELIYNWAYRSTHSMTVIGKAVTEAIAGMKIEYSYFMGTSGGGRQALTEAVRFPDDYDGVFSEAPAINWTKFIPAGIWPAMVMKEYDNYLSTEKMHVFREAVWEKYGGKEEYFSYRVIKRPEFDAAVVIGTETTDGIITELDAKVMQMIWDGPRDEEGNQLWFGFRPGGDCWGAALSDKGTGMAQVGEVNGKLDALVWDLYMDYVGAWLKRTKNCDWHAISMEEYITLFKESIDKYSDIASDNCDLCRFRKDGKKLLLLHGLDDQVLFPDGTIDFYKRVLRLLGSKEKVEDFMRFYPIPGDGHSAFNKNGSGPSLATCMTALMKWVEDGNAPTDLIGQRYDMETHEIMDIKAVPYLSLGLEDF